MKKENNFIYNLKELEERCNSFENFNSGELMLGLPVMIRMDGNNFKSFTHKLGEPYDIRLTNLMIEACKFAVQETNALCGFVGSDEITLVLYTDDYMNTQLYYGSKKRKIESILSAKVSVFFNKKLEEYLPEKKDASPSFDARVWNVPNLQEVCNAFYVREMSVYKNAITMACLGNKLYSNNDILGKNGRVKQEMLFQKGINFNDYPVEFKRGVYIQKRKVIRKYSVTEIDKLPLMHDARKNPNLEIERTEIRQVDMPVFSKITNPIETVIYGADPISLSEDNQKERVV